MMSTEQESALLYPESLTLVLFLFIFESTLSVRTMRYDWLLLNKFPGSINYLENALLLPFTWHA